MESASRTVRPGGNVTKLVSHEAARGVLVVDEELGDLLARLLLHELDEVARLLPGRSPRTSAASSAGICSRISDRVRGGKLLDHLGLDVRLQLVERLGRRLDVELPEDAAPLGLRHLADDLREVGGMEALPASRAAFGSRADRASWSAAGSSPTG